MLVGNITAGYAMDIFTESGGEINFGGFWAGPAIIAAICLVLVILLFKEPKEHSVKEVC